MTTPAERRALLLLTMIATLGVIVRITRAMHRGPAPTATDERALMAQIARVDSARLTGRRGGGGRGSVAGGGGSKGGRPAGRPDTSGALAASRRSSKAHEPARRSVDLDVASAGEIEGLPWIGVALAERIVSSRNACGPFGSLEALKRVYGVGEGMVKRLAPYVTFSSESRPLSAAPAPGCASADKRAAPRRRGRA